MNPLIVAAPANGGADASELLERQLHVFAKDAVAAYRREKTRAAELESALTTLETAFLETIRSMAFVVEAKDAYTGQHLERCRVYGMALMDNLGITSDYPDAPYGFLLHDSGKVGVPESILGKPGPLTAAEWRVMRTHPLIGYQMLAGIPFLANAAEIVRSHHEMWDGTGYPEGLQGEDIPLPARVFSVVDAFDAMTTNRPYRAALPLDYAAEEIARMAGTQFDAEVSRAFLAIIDRLSHHRLTETARIADHRRRARHPIPSALPYSSPRERSIMGVTRSRHGPCRLGAIRGR